MADTDIGYGYLMGLYTKPEDDPQAAGIRRVAWLQREFGKSFRTDLPPSEREYDYKAARSPEIKAISETCREPGPECLHALEQGSAALAKWSSSERWLFERYQVLIARPEWLETTPLGPDMPLPSYAVAMEGQKLLFVEAWTRAGEKDAAAVRDLLSRDLRFWRHTLECSDILISKMIAVAGLRRHFKFANLVLRRLPAGSEAAARPPEWVQEITPAERSMTRTLVGECVFSSRVVNEQDMSDWSPVAEEGTFIQHAFRVAAAPLFQKQDFSNEQAEMFVKATAALDVPYGQYRVGTARARAVLNGSQGELPMFRLYNPIGAFFRWISSANYATYSDRVVDIEGLRRAALLTSELRSRGVTAERVDAELRASTIREPYSDAPFGWDAAKNALTFTGLEPPPRGVHELIY